MCQSFAEYSLSDTRRILNTGTAPRVPQLGSGEYLRRDALRRVPGIFAGSALRRVPFFDIAEVSPGAGSPSAREEVRRGCQFHRGPCAKMHSAKWVPNGPRWSHFAERSSRRTTQSRRSVFPGDQMAPGGCLRRVPSPAKQGSPSKILGEDAIWSRIPLLLSNPCICKKIGCIHIFHLYHWCTPSTPRTLKWHI